MEYRELGKTGLKVPVLSYGASSLGGVFHSIKESEAKLRGRGARTRH